MSDPFEAIGMRDGLSTESVQVLVEMWAWPIGMALQPALDKAQQNHPDWQAWRDANRNTVPTLADWALFKLNKSGPAGIYP